jgi:hypothetical protein
MDSAREAPSGGRFTRPQRPSLQHVATASGSRANTVTASQARAARRREARRDEQAVAAWLRELSARGR